jgi:hypothetical protein
MSFKKTDLHALKEGDTILLGIESNMKPITGKVLNVRGEVVPSARGKIYDIGSHMTNTIIVKAPDGNTVNQSQINIFREEEPLNGKKQFEKAYVEEIKKGDNILFRDDDGRMHYGAINEKKTSEVSATTLKGSVIEGFTKTELLIQTREGIKELSETNFYKKY